jgi:hypothetical protein
MSILKRSAIAAETCIPARARHPFSGHQTEAPEAQPRQSTLVDETHDRQQDNQLKRDQAHRSLALSAGADA